MSDEKTKLESRKTCSVGLKSPNGLILRLFVETEQTENTNAGPRTFKKFEVNQKAGTVTLKGYGGAAFGERQAHRISGQYAITNNVPLDFMQEWMRQNKEMDLVKKELIFIMANENEAAAAGAERREVWDGLHPLKMPQGSGKVKDPRVPKKILKGDRNADDVADDEVMSRAESGVAA